MHGACTGNPMRLKLTRDDLFRMASGARGRAEGQLESMATGNILMVPLRQEKAQVLSRAFLHNGNWKCRRERNRSCDRWSCRTSETLAPTRPAKRAGLRMTTVLIPEPGVR